MAKKNDNLQALSTIERALGMIEGISYGVDEPIATGLIDAVGLIDNAVKEITSAI